MGEDLETRIAGHWFNYIGAVAIVIAAGLLLKFAYENGWIGPLAICACGWLAGLGLLAAGERFRSRLPLYGQVLAGTGAALLFVTTYGGYVRSGVLPGPVATPLLIGISALTVALSLRHNSLSIAALGTLLGYLSPALIGSTPGGSGAPYGLFTYLTALSLAVLGVFVARQWSALRLAAFAGTWVVFYGWYQRSYTPAFEGVTLVFLTGIFAIFLVATVANSLVFRRDGAEVDLPLMLLNPALSYGFGYYLAHRMHEAALGWGAILLAVIYWTVGAVLSARMDRTAYLSQLASGVGFVFAIIAVPVLLHGRFLTVAWAGEAAMLLMVAARTGAPMTRRWGVAALALTVLRLVCYEAWLQPSPEAVSPFTERGFAFMATLGAIAVATGIALFERNHPLAGVPGSAFRVPGCSNANAEPGSRNSELGTRNACEAEIFAGTLLFGGLLDFWVALEVSWTWSLALWAVVAGLALIGAQRERSGGMRAAGYLLAFGAAATVAARSLASPAAGAWAQDWTAVLACGLLFTAASAACLMEPEGQEQKLLAAPLLATAAGMMLLLGYLRLAPLWLPVLASLLGVGLVAIAAATGARADETGAPVRWLAFAFSVLPALMIAHRVTMLHVGGVGQLAPGFTASIALFAGTAAYVARSEQVGGEERPLAPVFAAGAVALGFWWAHLGLGAGFGTLAWAVAAAGVLVAGEWLGNGDVQGVGAVAALMVAARALLFEPALAAVHPALLHTRSLAFLAAIAAGAGAWWRLSRPEAPARSGWLSQLLAWSTSFLGLWWVSIEAMDLAGGSPASSGIGRAAWFALSAAWALYAAGAIAAGFIWRVRTARLAGLALLSLTVVKVFTLDVSSLDTGYRILSFAVLGVILMGVSYVYQRFQSQLRELLLA